MPTFATYFHRPHATLVHDHFNQFRCTVGPSASDAGTYHLWQHVHEQLHVALVQFFQVADTFRIHRRRLNVKIRCAIVIGTKRDPTHFANMCHHIRLL